VARILVSEIERSTVKPLDDAQAQVAALTTLAETTARLEGIASDCGIDPPPSLQAWTAIFDLLDDVSITLQKFYGDVFEQPLDEFAAALAPASSTGVRRLLARVTSRAYRRARKTLVALGRWEKPTTKELYVAAAAAAEQAAAWQHVAVKGSQPCLPADLVRIEAAYRNLSAEFGISHLAVLTPWELDQRLKALVGRAEALCDLPEPLTAPDEPSNDATAPRQPSNPTTAPSARPQTMTAPRERSESLQLATPKIRITRRKY
jgi:hypothetical protein